MEIGERLRSLREAKKMTIYKLSQETGISHNHISDLERGRRKPSIETLHRLIIPLDITLSELFSENEEATYLSDKEKQLIKHFRSLPNQQADKILELIEVMDQS